MINAHPDLSSPSIKNADLESAPVAAIVAALVVAIATSDGVLAPIEYTAGLAAADSIAGLTDDPAVLRSLILRAFNGNPRPLDQVLKELVTARGNIPDPARRPLLEALYPLLATQAEHARPLARRIAEVLEVRNVEPSLDLFSFPAETNGVSAALRWAGSAFSRSSPKHELAREIARFTADPELSQLLSASKLEQERNLIPVLAATVERLKTTLSNIQAAHEDQAAKMEVATSLEHTAENLERQFRSRLHFVERRIGVHRKHLREDIENFSEDGGDEAEVDLRRMSERRGLLKRHDDRDVRERMISKSLARRHERLKRRHDEQVQLLREELAEFNDDYVAASQEAVAPISLADWRLAVPGTSTSARIKEALDQGANRTLAGGAIAATGAVGAMSVGLVAPAAIVGVAAAPVGIAVAGAVAVAGVWKLFANREDRLRSEQRARTEATRVAARSKAEAAFADVSTALEEIAEEFRSISLSRVVPLRQNAERIREMSQLQAELSRRIVSDTHRRLEQWQKAISLPAQ